MIFTEIKVTDYKLLKNVTLSDLKKVNVIIGKNNSGKSSLIDVIAAAHDAEQYEKIQSNVGDIICGTLITDRMVQDLFGILSTIGGWNKNSYSQAVKGKIINFKLALQNIKWQGPSVKTELMSTEQDITGLKSHWESALQRISNSINKTCFRRMRAERNIVPEQTSIIGLSETGVGASNLIRKILTESQYDESLIERDLLNLLNSIIYPEGKFETIRIQQIENADGGIWEVFLQEKGQPRFALSKMGSGIKTIILVLLNLMVLPKIESGKNYVYAFEEIENNLHPALQRRMFDFLYDFAVQNDITIFLTTHSHVAINCYFDKEQAAIYHIEKKEGEAVLNRIETYLDKAEILSDLDVKASDILQSNGIIWVEGPSDRIYIRRWLEILTDNQFVEGKHYQFLYYGGRLLSHYAAKEETNLISILTTNRNAAIVIDSDRKDEEDPINGTKERIKQEFEKLHMFHWITEGKEIENYIPAEAVRKMFEKPEIKQCQQYELFPTYIEPYYPGFTGKKVAFAKQIAPFMDSESCCSILNLKEKIASITNLMGWHVTDILLPARIKQLKEKILIIRQSVSLPPYCFDHSVGSFH